MIVVSSLEKTFSNQSVRFEEPLNQDVYEFQEACKSLTGTWKLFCRAMHARGGDLFSRMQKDFSEKKKLLGLALHRLED